MPQPLLRAVPGRARSEHRDAFEGQDRAGFGVAAVEVDGELEEPVVEFLGVDEGLLEGPAAGRVVGEAAALGGAGFGVEADVGMRGPNHPRGGERGSGRLRLLG